MATDHTPSSSLTFNPPLKPVIINLVGEPESGKSTAIKALMHYYAKKKYFKFGICITGSAWNGDFDFLPKKAVWEGYDEDRFKAYIDVLEKRAIALHKQKKTLPPSFIILDDLLGEVDNSPWFRSLLYRFRQYKLTIFFSAQYAPDSKGSCTAMRACTNIAFMFPSTMKNQVEAMFRAWGGYFDNEEEFKRALIQVERRQYACLLFQKGMKEKKKAYMSFKVNPPPENFKIKF
jgi:ABC-type dipeptide/oligopeptide/nickel transport system ATPase component